jgi:hypothetical protein
VIDPELDELGATRQLLTLPEDKRLAVYGALEQHAVALWNRVSPILFERFRFYYGRDPSEIWDTSPLRFSAAQPLIDLEHGDAIAREAIACLEAEQ